ncbi:MAG TPA: hypothetical protein VGO52_19535 [Hyphomonadaceae bacterium]|nr:hypothetical protein [Hyphomonadaceae bacterium]
MAKRRTWEITFSTDKFRPFLPEFHQVNTDLYGYELADWLTRQLAARGIHTSYPNWEDWGWYLEHVSDAEEEVWIRCSSDWRGPDAGPMDWQVLFEQRGKLNKGSVSPHPVEAIRKAVLSLLAEENIQAKEVEWPL